jgi:hypothetical protein
VLLAALTLLLLAGCGGPSQPAQAASSFVLSQAGGVTVLAWTTQSGQVNGTYTVTTARTTQTAGVTGQQPDAGAVTLQIEGIGEMSGTVSGATMQTNGTGGNLTWYAATREQAAQIQSAYQAYQKVQADSSALQIVEGTPPNNSFPGYYQSAWQGAKQRVIDEQSALTLIQQQSDPLNRCMYLESFTANFPPADQDSELHLPFSLPGDTSAQAVVDRSDLSTTIALLSNDFQAAQALPLPLIRGLPLVWKIDAGPQLAQARQQLSSLQQTILSVAPKFPGKEKQAAQIQAQVAAIQKQHPCFG